MADKYVAVTPNPVSTDDRDRIGTVVIRKTEESPVPSGTSRAHPLAIHRDLASHLGSACARKRSDYYARIGDSYLAMARDAFAVADVYVRRSAEAKDGGEECEE